MSDKEHVWIPKLKRQLADKLITRREFVRYSTLLGMSAGAAYMWAGKITGQPFAPPAMRRICPKGGTIKVAMRVPKVDNPHTFSWVYDSNIVRQIMRLPNPHRRGQRHPAASRVKVGSLARSQDLDAHHGGHDLARRPQIDGRTRRVEHQALP